MLPFSLSLSLPDCGRLLAEASAKPVGGAEVNLTGLDEEDTVLV